VDADGFEGEAGIAEDADPQVIEIVRYAASQHAEAFETLCLPQLVFEALAFFNIGEGSQPLGEDALGVGNTDGAQLTAAVRLCLRAPNSYFHVKCPAGGEAVAPISAGALPIVFMNRVEPIDPFAGARLTGERFPVRLTGTEVPVSIGGPDDTGSTLNQRAITLFGLAHRLLRPLAFHDFPRKGVNFCV